jgi:hypothetical protein
LKLIMIVYKHHKIESKYKIMNISFVVNMPALLVSESDFVTNCSLETSIP